MTGVATERAPLDSSAVYRDAYQAMADCPLRDRLHSLAHDSRIPAGALRAWAFRYLRVRAGDFDGHGKRVSYTTPPSASCSVDDIVRVTMVCRELVPDFHGERYRSMRAEVLEVSA